MIIRPIEPADRTAWDALYAGYADFYGVPQTAEMRARVWGWIFDPDHEVSGIVADVDGTLVGFAHIRAFARPLAAATGLFLDDLFVAPEARGSGAAPALLSEVKSIAAREGHVVVRWITADDNHRARTLYDRHAKATHWVTYDMDAQ